VLTAPAESVGQPSKSALDAREQATGYSGCRFLPKWGPRIFVQTVTALPPPTPEQIHRLRWDSHL
jgi:hypothetical protein